ncbi:MAG: nucleotide sugar dehydrogenase [Flavobacteriales bacterium]|nr:nucleotide sugar dehydrogenase [Flavobacteriales bacterium]
MGDNIYNRLVDKKEKLAVIGLGYVGLPIALEFARKISVIGFDINAARVEMMRNGIDPSNELPKEDFEGCDIVFTDSLDVLREATFFIVAVPTPIDNFNHPDLTPLLKASETVGKALKKGDFVVFESTVYPGCTEEDCIPVLEKFSGLSFKKDFKVGYSPERINPGDKEHTLSKITKVVSGCCDESLNIIAKTYELVVEAGVHRAATIKTAEAAKIIENTQRDLNIALMNELSVIFGKMGINTYDVLEAAGTKWNFLKFSPGLVGGHCIGVDPYYLTHKAKQLGYHAKVILSGREINDYMGAHVARQVVKKLIEKDAVLKESRILVLGATFKENVSDIRNSKVIDVLQELESYSLKVEAVDPHASAEEFEHEYNFSLSAEPTGIYDAVVVAVAHKEYVNLTSSDFSKLLKPGGILADLKGLYRKAEWTSEFDYWCL